MPRLILLNGAPAAGKSTLARRYAADHPDVRVIELDALVADHPNWRTDVTAAYLAARERAVDHARQLLGAGLDVLVPQFLARPEFIDRLESLACEVGVPFIELALRVDPDTAVARFTGRLATDDDPLHEQAVVVAETAGGLDMIRDACARIETLPDWRPAVIVVDSTDPDQTYARVLTALDPG